MAAANEVKRTSWGFLVCDGIMLGFVCFLMLHAAMSQTGVFSPFSKARYDLLL